MILCISIQAAYGQNQPGFETYYYSGYRAASALVPRVWWQGQTGWYGEARYNYEKANAFSMYAGHTFTRQHGLVWSITPFAGIVGGSFNGGSAGLNVELEKRGFSFTSNLQYTVSAAPANGNFLYSWSELGYQVTDHFYAGIALQQTGLCRTGNDWEPGVQLSFSWGAWRFPIYLFEPQHSNKVVVLGISRDLTYGK